MFSMNGTFDRYVLARCGMKPATCMFGYAVLPPLMAFA